MRKITNTVFRIAGRWAETGIWNLTNMKRSVNLRMKVKVKVKLSLCLTNYHAMKAYWGVEVYLHACFDIGTSWR
jgi:D-hexose-6-phosphate mutarotase